MKVQDRTPERLGPYRLLRRLGEGGMGVREVASKTSDVAGDGTTTATVLAQAIFREGVKTVAAGASPTALKRGIERAVEAVRRGNQEAAP